MTERSSARLHAQAMYRDACVKAPQDTPLPNPPPQGGRERAECAARGETLTERVRRLYEGGAVPVREIARLAGVTERTIYKHAAKQNWKPRYAWEGGGRPQMRGERWRAAAAADAEVAARDPARNSSRDFAPVRGAGARFVRREERGKPYPTGLKATDPAGAARAMANCARAQAVADPARETAEGVRWLEACNDAWTGVNKALKALADFREERRSKPQGRDTAGDDVLENALRLSVDIHLDVVRALRREREAKDSA